MSACNMNSIVFLFFSSDLSTTQSQEKNPTFHKQSNNKIEGKQTNCWPIFLEIWVSLAKSGLHKASKILNH